eukprot:g3361.t1
MQPSETIAPAEKVVIEALRGVVEELKKSLDDTSASRLLDCMKVPCVEKRRAYVAAAAAASHSWEQMHLGPWREVAPVWRILYMCACVRIARWQRDEEKNPKSAMRTLDMASMLGGAVHTGLQCLIESMLEQTHALVASSDKRQKKRKNDGNEDEAATPASQPKRQKVK